MTTVTFGHSDFKAREFERANALARAAAETRAATAAHLVQRVLDPEVSPETVAEIKAEKLEAAAIKAIQEDIVPRLPMPAREGLAIVRKRAKGATRQQIRAARNFVGVQSKRDGDEWVWYQEVPTDA